MTLRKKPNSADFIDLVFVNESGEKNILKRVEWNPDV